MGSKCPYFENKHIIAILSIVQMFYGDTHGLMLLKFHGYPNIAL